MQKCVGQLLGVQTELGIRSKLIAYLAEETSPVYPSIFQDDRPLKDIMAEIECTLLTQAIEHYVSVNKVAERFGINRSTLFRKLQEKP